MAGTSRPHFDQKGVCETHAYQRLRSAGFVYSNAHPTLSPFTAVTPKPNIPTSPRIARTATTWGNERPYWVMTSRSDFAPWLAYGSKHTRPRPSMALTLRLALLRFFPSIAPARTATAQNAPARPHRRRVTHILPDPGKSGAHAKAGETIPSTSRHLSPQGDILCEPYTLRPAKRDQGRLRALYRSPSKSPSPRQRAAPSTNRFSIFRSPNRCPRCRSSL